MKKLLSIILLGLTSSLFSQTVIINNQQRENSAETETKYKNADYFREVTQKALNNKDLDKAKYYLQQWHHNGGTNAAFYELWADYYILMGRPRTAKKLLMRAYRKCACFECKEKANNIK